MKDLPTIVVEDLKIYRHEDVPEEILTALAKELLLCPLCYGLGATIREDHKQRPFAWPCPYDCDPPLTCIVANKRKR